MVDVTNTLYAECPVTMSRKAMHLIADMVPLSPYRRTQVAMMNSRFPRVGRLLGDANLLNEHRCARVMGESKRSREYFDDVSERWATAATAADYNANGTYIANW